MNRWCNARWWAKNALRRWGYPWLITWKRHNTLVNEVRWATQKQGTAMVEKERENVDRLMNKMYRLNVEGREGPNLLRVGVYVDIDRFLLYNVASDQGLWDYFAERLAWDIGRELKTMNFVTVREEIHRNSYEPVRRWDRP